MGLQVGIPPAQIGQIIQGRSAYRSDQETGLYRPVCYRDPGQLFLANVCGICILGSTCPRMEGNRGATGGGGAEDDALLPFPLTDMDRDNLAQTDDQFQPHTWQELKQIIGVCTQRQSQPGLV